MSKNADREWSSFLRHVALKVLCPCVVMSAVSIRCSNGVDSSRGHGAPEPPSDTLIVLAEPSEYDAAPRLLIDVDPEYPRLARQAGLEGTVWVDAFVNMEGSVDSTRVSETSGTRALDYSAEYVAFKRVYYPAKKGLRRVAVWIRYREVFSLDSLYGE